MPGETTDEVRRRTSFQIERAKSREPTEQFARKVIAVGKVRVSGNQLPQSVTAVTTTKGPPGSMPPFDVGVLGTRRTSAILICDKPHASLEGDIGGRPLDHHQNPVPEADQLEDMKEEPGEPGKRS